MQRKKLWSDILGTQISMNVTTAALRIIDRKGGLDNYILETTPEKLNSAFGERIRKALFEEMRSSDKIRKDEEIVAAQQGTRAGGAAGAAGGNEGGRGAEAKKGSDSNDSQTNQMR